MDIPTLYDWMGGKATLERLTAEFYGRVHEDAVLAPVFAAMDERHPAHVAAFLGEVFGGPPAYSASHGGHAGMIRHHLGRHLTEAQRRRWIALLLDAARDVGAPQDPEFNAALVAYLEWGSRLAVINSQPDAEVHADAPMPIWGWGVPGGPYVPGAGQ